MACLPNFSVQHANMENRSKKEHTLYVSNLPQELTQYGIKEVFNEYGKVIGTIYRSTWAYITYESYHEAEEAIKDLHDKPPLRLKVSFAKEKESKSVQMPIRPLRESTKEQYGNHMPSAPQIDRSHLPTKGRGQPLNTLLQQLCTSTVGNTQNDLLYPVPADPYTYNPYDNSDQHTSTNTLWTRGEVTVTPDGSRHVVLGRGYTKYAIPNPCPGVQNQVTAVHAKRSSAACEYGQAPSNNEIGKCKKCSGLTKYTCERCHGFYCSRRCQVADWQQHMAECHAIPALIMSVSTASISSANSEDRNTVQSTAQILRRPKICAKNNEMHGVGTMDLSSAINTQCGSNISEEVPWSDVRNMTQAKINRDFDELVKSVDSSEKSAFQNISHSKHVENQKKAEIIEKLPKLNAIKIEDNLAFQKQTFLSRTKFTNVRIVMATSDREYWTQRVDDDKGLRDLMIKLQHQVDETDQANPVAGEICAAKYDAIWHRAMIVSTRPLRIRYIDYGNEELREIGDLKKLINHTNVPAFAKQIRLSEKAAKKHRNLQCDYEISVKQVSSADNDVIDVEVQGECDDCCTTTDKPTEIALTQDNASKTLNKLSSVISILSYGVSGIFLVHEKLSHDTFAVTLVPANLSQDFTMLFTDMANICTKMSTVDTNFSPQVGEIVCGKTLKGEWFRGNILSLGSPSKMAIVDEARMMEITKVVPCTERFMKIPAFGVVCKITNDQPKLEIPGQLMFSVKNTELGNAQYEIEIVPLPNIPQLKIKGIVMPWAPLPEQQRIQFTLLKPESEICLTAYRSQNQLFARSLDSEEVERYNKIMQAVAKYAQTAPALKEPPSVGQMVMAIYLDDNHYRAVVTQVEGEKVGITYVDFGNRAVTTWSKLKVLSNDLEQLQPCTESIVLKGITRDISMTKQANDYLTYLVGKEMPLRCSFTDSPTEDGVILKLANGECVNDKLNDLLKPDWKKPSQETGCYMIDQLSVANLGAINSEVEAVILNCKTDGHEYVLCPFDGDLVNYVCEELHTTMTEYCEGKDYYIPRDTELCLAVNDSGWCRAVCITRNETPTTSTVFFVDFGVTASVSHKDIRCMHKDFLTASALASICTVVNLAPTDAKGNYTPEVYKRIADWIQPYQKIKILIKKQLEDGTFEVELPHIRALLVAERLV